MSRHSSTFNQGYNSALDLVRETGVGKDLPTETALSNNWGISRTTVRSILASLQQAGIIEWSGRSKEVLRAPKSDEYFSEDDTSSHADRLPSLFMDYIFKGEPSLGDTLNESLLAKQFNVSSTVVREFLIRFSRFGLIEKMPNRHWVLHGFTREFAEELFAVREMFEERAFKRFLEAGDKVHHRAVMLKAEHESILKNPKSEFLQFPQLDEKFHRIWIDTLDNRFVQDFFELVSLIFHYHYRWNKLDEMERNRDAAEQHLMIITALEAGDKEGAEAAFLNHLAHAKETLFASVFWEPNNRKIYNKDIKTTEGASFPVSTGKSVDR